MLHPSYAYFLRQNGRPSLLMAAYLITIVTVLQSVPVARWDCWISNEVGEKRMGSRMGSPDWQSPPALGNDPPSPLFPKFLQPHACLRGPEASQASFYIYRCYLKSHTWEDPVPPRQNLQPFVVSGLPKPHFPTRLPSQLKFLPHGPNTFF